SPRRRGRSETGCRTAWRPPDRIPSPQSATRSVLPEASGLLPSAHLRTANATAFRRPVAPALSLGSRVQGFDRCAASAARPAVPQRPAVPHPAAQADRPSGVRLRRVVLGGLRPGGDLRGVVGGGGGRL